MPVTRSKIGCKGPKHGVSLQPACTMKSLLTGVVYAYWLKVTGVGGDKCVVAVVAGAVQPNQE